MGYYLPQIIATALALILLYAAKLIIRKLTKRFGQLVQKSEARMNHMNHVISILLNFVFFILLTLIWGVDPDNLLISISSIFAVIGVAFFAQWSILSIITAGIIMFFAAPYRVGDRIRLIDKDMPIEATIESILTFYTHVRTIDNQELIILPNNLFLQKAVSVYQEKTGE